MGRISQGTVLKVYHVELAEEDGWYIGRVLERAGITTQGRSLDELLFMVRDAIDLMWGERNVQLELIAAPDITGTSGRRPRLAAGRTARSNPPKTSPIQQ